MRPIRTLVHTLPIFLSISCAPAEYGWRPGEDSRFYDTSYLPPEDEAAFHIKGMSDGAILYGDVVVEAVPLEADAPVFHFAVDGALLRSDDLEPFCLGGESRSPCAPWDARAVGPGDHELTVVMEHEDGDVTRTLSFEVVQTRDPAWWPFAADSPWNTSLGSGALYAPISSPNFDSDGGEGLNVTEWTHPVYRAGASDPVRRVDADNGEHCASTEIPDGAVPDPETDAHLHVISEDHLQVVETWRARRTGSHDILAGACAVNDLKGPGVFDYWNGTRAYGGSAIAGLIREGELTHGIPHALAVAVSRSAMNRNGTDGDPWIWPASCADNSASRDYGTWGNLFMGSLLAIPPDVDLESLDLSPAGLQVGRALQDFGAYITDSADNNIAFYVEPAAADEVDGTLWDDLDVLTRYLQVVTNNTEVTVGGGGTRRRGSAPPFDR